MYLLIFTDTGVIQKTREITKTDIECCRSWLCKVIRISNPENPTIFNGETGEWEDIA